MTAAVPVQERSPVAEDAFLETRLTEAVAAIAKKRDWSTLAR